MPHSFEIDHKHLPRELDRRVKITPFLREIIKEMRHWHEQYPFVYRKPISLHKIEKMTGVSRRMIQFILYPERLKKVKEQFKQRRKDGRYYYKETWATTMREHH
jgi:hypothetical protein